MALKHSFRNLIDDDRVPLTQVAVSRTYGSGDRNVLTIPRNAIDATDVTVSGNSTFAGRRYTGLLPHLSRHLRATNLRADPGPAATG